MATIWLQKGDDRVIVERGSNLDFLLRRKGYEPAPDKPKAAAKPKGRKAAS